MKQETLEEVAERFIKEQEYKSLEQDDKLFEAILFGAKWQQEKDKDFYFNYIKSEMDFQKLRIAKLGINTTNQIFEQQVTSLIHLAERSYNDEEVLDIIYKFKQTCPYFIEEWFNKIKKEIRL